MIQTVFRFSFFKLPLFAALLVCFTAPAYVTASAAETRIAIVDIQRVLLQSKAGKRARESFEKEFRNKQAILDDKSRQYEKMEKDLTKNLSIMNEETLKSKSEELDKAKKDLVRAKEDFSDELRRKQEEMRFRIFKQIQSVVDEFGKSRGYSMILAKDTAGVIFMSESVDVTEKVTDLYDRNY